MLKLKKSIITALLLLGSLFQFAQAQEVKQVAITSIVEHPSLDNIRRGVQDELVAQGYTLGQDLIVQYRSAQGSSATAAQIAKQFAASKPDVIVAIATPSAQAVAAATRTVPLVFAAITDPIAAKLIKGWEPTGTNITGVSDMLPLEPQIDLMLKIRPDLKTVGYVYSPGEVNSTAVLRRLEEALAKRNINVLAAPAQKTSDVISAARSLRGKVELIYTTTDNNVVSAYEALVKFASESKIPLVASDPDSVERGAAAALGISYYEFGRQTGQVVLQILKGEKPGDITPTISNSTTLILNPAAAHQQGVTFSAELLQSASKIIDK
ncbi:ABC transporter substrate-binding protein [Zophobihabitans entericus]|uniref:ABC transporter substrate-binding protein n=1 Tax=Zophobihabitans entericus TaxID=1635327 RepID=A0A6G9IER7_9GAMM|nr:ABC transporter substrate-binding protein [Zophobihabitans entericus]QIQ22299.1 ABC transporter substrate-binding protein [Zophobihabitans entericus]